MTGHVQSAVLGKKTLNLWIKCNRPKWFNCRMKKFYCPTCGYVYEGEEKPLRCPICGKEMIEVEEEETSDTDAN